MKKEKIELEKIPGFKFWGEDPEEDKEIMRYFFIQTFGKFWNSKEDEEAWKDL